MTRASLILFLLLACPLTLSATGLNTGVSNSDSDIEALRAMDSDVRAYMKKWELHGAALAVVRNDSLVYAKGYGWADEAKKEEMRPGTLMRVASVSKLITAAGIMSLCERGALRLDDKVYAEGGILADSLHRKAALDTNWNRITVEHLLRHEAGFYIDPMFSSPKVRSVLGLKRPPVADEFIDYTLSKRARFIPGTDCRYSNVGYVILSKIIEKVSGMDYETCINDCLLKPAGCEDFHLARNYYSERYPGEARYYPHEKDETRLVDEYTGSGRKVERCYGGNNVSVLSGAGAWCCSVVELAKFVSSIDGRDEVADVLEKSSVRTMTDYNDSLHHYSIGWNFTKPEQGWRRTGTFSGTSALIYYFPDGECWIFVTNTSTWRGPYLENETAGLFRECRKKYDGALPRRNLFKLGPQESNR